MVTPVTAGWGHTCARKTDGAIRCWGDNTSWELGYPPDSSQTGDVDVGKEVLELSLGGAYSCALLQDGAVRCWGSNGSGQLGYGTADSVGDDPGETPATAGDVNLGGSAVHIDSSSEHSCAALVDGTVRCWGDGGAKLGYGDGDLNEVGLSQTPAERGVVDVGGRAVQVAAGGEHSCALLDDGTVRCWGPPALLGTLAELSVGGRTPPSSGPVVDLGGKAIQITAGGGHTCALLEDKTVRCWGVVGNGQLGYGDLEPVGDDETPAEKGPVDVGGPVVQISAGQYHTCAVLEGGSVRCWGRASEGQLGYGNLEDIGDDETPGSLPEPVDVGGEVSYVSAGGSHTCAVLMNGAIRCWGSNQLGALGYADADDIGDNESPASAGDVPWLD
jgi:alpha-tubulin suppressor-like RCC1 family protein